MLLDFGILIFYNMSIFMPCGHSETTVDGLCIIHLPYAFVQLSWPITFRLPHLADQCSQQRRTQGLPASCSVCLYHCLPCSSSANLVSSLRLFIYGHECRNSKRKEARVLQFSLIEAEWGLAGHARSSTPSAPSAPCSQCVAGLKNALKRLETYCKR